MANLESLFPWQFLSFLLSYMFLFCFFNMTMTKLRRVFSSNNNGPPTYPIIGCLISFYRNQTRLLDWYTELLTESATNTIVVQRLGARRTIVTANPANVEYMLKTNFSNFPKGKPFTEILGDFLGSGIFNVDGELWHIQRKFASHEFKAKSLRDFFILTLEEEVENGLLPVLESLAKKQEVVDLQELLRRLAFNIICKISLGIDRCSLDPSLPIPPLAMAFDLASMISAKRGAAPLFVVWKVKRWLGIGSERQLKDAVERVHNYVGEIIINKRKTLEERVENESDDLLSRLILSGHEEKTIRDMVISFMMAGRDTTSAAMTWLFWLLSCYPNIEQEVVKETRSKTAEKIDYKSLKMLKLLKACLCESMRLYPPVAWDSKHALTDDRLPDNTRVRAGDRVTYFPYGMGRMEGLWGKDWPEFNPDRWFVGSKRSSLRKPCPYKFPIFQAGPRECLGKQMAFIQMKYVVASILRQFEVRPVSPDKPVFVPYLTAHMAGGLKVLVRKRSEISRVDQRN